jgi:cell division protein FtsX
MRNEKMKNIFTDFAYGLIIGFITAVIICGIITGLMYVNHKQKERLNYVERQIEIKELRDDIINRDFVEFLETMPDVRTAADGAITDFERKRDEILERFRSRIID